MENEHASLSEVSTDCSSNDESIHNIDNQGKELSDDENRKADQRDTDLSLDLRSMFLNCDPISENDDSLEKPSAVREQPEDSSVILEGTQSLGDDQEDKSLKYFHTLLPIRIKEMKSPCANWCILLNNFHN